nr:immunoglobulin heavy chain junction region [Mus musculus]
CARANWDVDYAMDYW